MIPITIYRKIWIFKDPSMAGWENLMKEKYKDIEEY